jgi:hypothetical protein
VASTTNKSKGAFDFSLENTDGDDEMQSETEMDRNDDAGSIVSGSDNTSF